MRLRRLPPRMLLSYLALVALTLFIVARLPGAAEWAAEWDEPAVPALALRPAAGASAAGAARVAAAGRAWAQRLRPGANWFEARLAEGLSGYGLSRERRGALPPSSALRRGVELLSLFLVGIDPADPRTVLGAHLPALAAREPAGEIELDAPPPGLRFDPRQRLLRPPAPEQVPDTPREQFGDRPLVGFYSTHHFESFASELAVRPEAPGDFAVYEDNRRNVVAVAAEMAKTLSERYGIGAAHSPARHDQGGYALSYDYSRVTAQRMLRSHPSIRLLVDVHRDSTPRGGETVKRVNGRDYAGVRFVVGRGNPASRAYQQPNYRRTRAFAAALFALTEELYPGLRRDIFERDARYNQDLLPGAILLEIGGPENTMEEALRSARAMAHVLAEAIRRDLVPR